MFVSESDFDHRVQLLLTAGFSRSAVARRLEVDRDTVRRAAARVGFPSRARFRSGVDWSAVQEFYERGHSVEECKRRFGFSSSAWESAVCRGEVVPRVPPTKRRPSGATRRKVAELLEQDMRPSEVARELGVSKPTVSYHARRLGIPARESAARRYDWEQIREAYERGLTLRQCQSRFGFSCTAWADAVKRGAVVPRARELPLDELLVVGRPGTNRNHLKARLIKAGLKQNRCERCGITEWMGAPLNMELHHVNGDGTDNRLQNLQLLCGNCHAQTDNWGGRGRGRKPVEVR
jgi:transposase-like protein